MKHIYLKQIQELNDIQWDDVLHTVKQSKINLYYFDKKFKGTAEDLKNEWLDNEILDIDDCGTFGYKYYVLCVKEKVVGVACFVIGDTNAEIIVAVNKKYRNKGFGKILVLMAECEFLNAYQVKYIVADIYNNEPSLKLFLSCGYLSNGVEYIKWFSLDYFRKK